MKLKPTAISFFMRYFIFPYFFLWSIFALFIKEQIDPTLYVLLWIFMTMLPALLYTFKRVRFGWFFWIGLLDFLAFLPKMGSIYSKIESLSSNEIYHVVLNWFQNFSEIKVFMVISIIGMILVQIYRLTFSYEIGEGGISLKSGIFLRKDRTVISSQITDLEVRKSFFQRIFRIGSVIPITASGMGAGSNAVMGAVEAKTKAGVGGIIGTARTQNVAINDPSYVLYGIRNPDDIKKKIISLIRQMSH